MTTVPGTPIDALAQAFRATSGDGRDAEPVAREVHEYLTDHGWELTQRPAGNILTLRLDPDLIPSVDQITGDADALAHSFGAVLDTTGVRFGTDVYWALVVDNLQSLGWHLLHSDEGEALVVVEADRDYITFKRGEVAVVLSPGAADDVELGAIARCVSILTELLPPDGRRRAARYLTHRFATETGRGS